MPNEPEPQSPSPSRESAPPPAEAGSSTASARASRSEGVPFIGDAGPQFDPENAPPPPPRPEPAAPPAPLIEWEQDTVEALLRLKGRALHAGIGVAESDWQYTELDLAAIAPPLTRIANRYEPVQRLAKHADPLILLFALGGYGVRSLEERAAVLRALEPEDTVPIGPAEEQPINAAEAPTPATAPRQTQWSTSAQGPPPAPAAAPPPRPPRPAEADVDPTQVEWEVRPR